VFHASYIATRSRDSLCSSPPILVVSVCRLYRSANVEGSSDFIFCVQQMIFRIYISFAGFASVTFCLNVQKAGRMLDLSRLNSASACCWPFYRFLDRILRRRTVTVSDFFDRSAIDQSVYTPCDIGSFVSRLHCTVYVAERSSSGT